MGNRNRKRNYRRKSRFLRFEPLELRLQFAVDYPIWETGVSFLSEPEVLASSEPVSAWSVYEFGATAAPAINTIHELNPVSGPVEQFGLSAPYASLSPDSVTPVFEYLAGAVPNNHDSSELSDEAWLLGSVENPLALDASTPNMDFADSFLLTELEQPRLQATQQVFEFDDLNEFEWTGVAVPLEDQPVSFGPTSFEPWIVPTALLRHSPAVDAVIETAEVFPTLAQEVHDQGFAFSEAPIGLSQTRLSSSFELSQASPYQIFGEPLNLKFHVASQDRQPPETVDQVAGRTILSQDSQDTYYNANTLDGQPFIEPELDAQLPVDKSTHSNSRTSRSRTSANVVVVAPGHASSKSTNAVLAVNMLPPGMLPIGNEPARGPASNSQDYAGNQHFIVQTALICESLNIVVRHEESQKVGNDEPLAARDFDLASPGRSLEIAAAGFVLFVIQTQFRLPKPLRNYWEKCVARFKRPHDGG